MPRLSRFGSVPALFLVFAHVVHFSPVAAQQETPLPRSQPDFVAPPVHLLSVNGMISDAVSHVRLDRVKVELRSLNGGVVGTVLTNPNGVFHFDKVGPGTYSVTVEQVGYQLVNERVDVVNSPVYGIQVELLRTPSESAPVNKSPGTLSLRALSIPRKARKQMDKGMTLLYRNFDFIESLKAFERAIHEYPDYYEAYAQIGIAYTRLADMAKAEKAFQKSINMSHERHVEAYIGLAELFLNDGRFAEAEPLMRKAVEIDSTSWRAHANLARVLLQLHRPSESETSATVAVKLRPNEAILYLVLANAHVELHDNRALLNDLNHYLDLAPNGSFADQARRELDRIQRSIAAPPSSPDDSTASLPR
jgi:hypothetical protein